MTKMILTLGIVACCLHPRPGGAVLIFDPSHPGPFDVLRFEYGPTSDDASDPLRTDISAHVNALDAEVQETRNKVPLRGVGHIPDGRGPFPLVLIVHGNNPNPMIASHEGFNYLTELLASHGMIAISIDENFLNGSPKDEIDARAIVLLRHLQLWRRWNGDPQHLFLPEVDLDRIGLIGHSRGGEAITVANLFNRTLHDGQDADRDFDFGIKALFAFAPTDGRIGNSDDGNNHRGLPVVIDNADIFILHGSRDSDIFYFDGQKTYDRAFPKDTAAGGSKGLVFVHGANHNFWNGKWGDDSGTIKNTPVAQLERAAQEHIAKVYVSGFFQWSLQGRKAFEPLLTGDARFRSLDGVTLVRQFSHRERIDLDNYEDEDDTTGSYPGVFNSGSLLSPFSEQDITGKWDEAACSPTSDLFLWNETRALVVGWNSTAATYTIKLPADIAGYVDSHPYLSLRIGQIHGSDPVTAKDVSIQLQLGTTAVSPALRVSSFGGPLLYPLTTFKLIECPEGLVDITKSVMRTVRIPLRSFVTDLREGALAHLSGIQIRFEPSSAGLVVIDDIQLSK